MVVPLTCRPLCSPLGRLTLSETLKSDPTDCQTSSQQCPSPPAAESTLSSAPPEPSDSFQKLHSSLAPQNRSLSNSPSGSLENLSSVEDSENMAEKKRKAPPPPSSVVNGMHTGGREIHNPAYVEPDTPQQNQKKSLPLPDYETLFPQKRHGVQGHTRWDHIIAEVNQKHRNSHVELSGKEMSVDCPEEQEANLPWESSTVRQTHPEVPKPVSSKNVAAPAPPKPESSQRQTLNQTRSSYVSSDPSPLQKPVSTDRTIMESLMSRNGARKALQPPATALQAPKPKSQIDPDSSPQSNQRNILTSANKDAPMAKPRQRVSGKEPVLQEESEIAPDRNTVSDSNVNIRERTDRHTAENFAQFDPFPNNELLSKDPWEQTKHNHDVDNFFSANLQKEKKPEEQGMAADDLDNIFSSENTTDPFTVLNGTDSYEDTEYRNKSLPAQHQTDLKTQNYSIKDTFGADPFTIPSLSLMASSEPLPVVMEEPAAGGLAGGKTPLRAWVSPSEGQPVSAQNSSGGGLALTQRR